MKKIVEIIKKNKVYDVQFNDQLITVEPEIFLKYHLKLQLEIDQKTFNALCHDNAFTYFNKLGIAKLKRMLTVHEMQEYLFSKGASEAIVKQLIHHYIEKKYLDDFAYARLYTQLKQTSEGPAMISNKLHEKGISREIIEGFTKRIDEQSILKEQLPKKMASIKNKSKKQMIQTLKGFYLRKGFSLEAVDQVIKKSLSAYSEDEIALIKKNYAKLYRKYSTKIDEKELKYFLIQKLYAKGFKIEDIKKVIV